MVAKAAFAGSGFQRLPFAVFSISFLHPRFEGGNLINLKKSDSVSWSSLLFVAMEFGFGATHATWTSTY